MATNNHQTQFNGQSNISNVPTPSQITNGQSHGFSLNENGSQARTLYVGNLDPQVSESFVLALFSQIGEVTNFKIIHEPGNDPYCFVEFGDHNSAANALLTMNKRHCLGRELKVNWASSATSNAPKMDTSKHYHIFVGDLSPDIDTPQLRDAFMPFGEITDCRVVRDLQTFKSRGYGFVSFLKKADAENAISFMNGQWLGSRAIRTNWATRKPPTARTNGDGQNGMQNSNSNVSAGPHLPGNGKQLCFEEVYGQTSTTNCTVYCGGLTHGLSEELIQKSFYQFGPIQEIRVFKDKGYAFVKFMSKESATNAICAMQNMEINGNIIKCSWGKESNDHIGQMVPVTAVAANGMGGGGAAAAQYAYPYHAHPYWYSQGYAHPMAAQALAGQFAAVQPGIASMQAYPYGQYYAAASSPGNFNALMAWQAAPAGSIPLGSSAPPTAAGQPQQPPTTSAPMNGLTPAVQQPPQGIAPQPQQMVGAYTMQPYQAQ